MDTSAMLKIVSIVLVIISECGAQYYENTPKYPVDCRSMEDVLRFGGCFRKKFLCQDKDRSRQSLLAPSDMPPFVFNDTVCFCDADCWKYKDCCVDAIPAAPTAEEDIRWKCDPLPSFGTMQSIYVVGFCPLHWHDTKEVAFCERRVSDDEYSYLLDIPVFSIHTRRAYSNIYCAKCHKDFRLSAIRVNLVCPIGVANCTEILQRSHYIFGEHKWQIYARGKYFGKYVYLEVSEYFDWEGPKSSYAIRRCRPVIDSCSDDNQYAEKCISNYAYHIRNTDYEGRIYKNVYCALCNNISLNSSVKCFDAMLPMTLPQLYPSNGFSFQGCQDYTSHPGIQNVPLAPYSWLFDFHDSSGTNEVGLKSRCMVGEIFDPISDLCIPFKCGKQFIKVDGECVDNGLNATQNDTIQLSECHMLPIKKEEITVLRENNSIYINKTGLVYESGYYEEYDNETYLVCHHLDLHIEKFSTMQSNISQVLVALSLTCLALHIAIHASIAKLRNLPGKNLISLSVSLFIAQLLFMFNSVATEFPGLCSFIAIVTHFCFLAAFFWMNVIAFDIYHTFSRVTSRSNTNWHSKIFWRYSAHAWLTPLAIVLTALIIDYTSVLPDIRPGYGTRICWLNQRQGLLVFFALPLAFLLVANIVFFLLTAYAIQRTTKLTQSVAQNKKDKVRFFLYVKLALIMGLTWVIGYISAVVKSDPMWYVFIVFNASQGAFIFIAFSLKRKLISLVVERLKDKLPNVAACSNSTNHSTNIDMSCNKTSADWDKPTTLSENTDSTKCS